jgi:hypothetical protein
MTENLGRTIEQQIEGLGPRSILAVGTRAGELAHGYQQAHENIRVSGASTEAILTQSEAVERYDLALVADGLESLPGRAAGVLIARLRDLLAPATLLILRMDESSLGHRDMLGYGFDLMGRFTEDDVRVHVYRFAIDSYKLTPDWLNPRYWANPDRWNKERW